MVLLKCGEGSDGILVCIRCGDWRGWSHISVIGLDAWVGEAIPGTGAVTGGQPSLGSGHRVG